MNNNLVSVVLATYNMSRTLKLTIESVLYQTHSEFELLIVGDHCTDDSEEVAKSFGDSRIQWFNLPSNTGNQWKPNNFGLSIARGDVIAYQGHDDIWAPAHLQRGLEALVKFDADIAVNMCLYYGPPESKMRGCLGLFPNDQYSPQFFFPPASMLHRRALIDRVGMWRPPDAIVCPPDVDLILRCYRAGASIVSTRAPTLFKFSTTHQRDAYRDQVTEPLETALAALREDADNFVTSELVLLAQSVIEDRFVRFERVGRDAEPVDQGRIARRQRQFKGSHDCEIGSVPKLGTDPVRFYLDEEFTGFEWHVPENDPTHGPVRWSGPSTKSAIRLPVLIDRPTQVRIHVLYVVEPDTLEGVSISFNGTAVAVRKRRSQHGTWLLEATIVPQAGRNDSYVNITVPRTARPLDLHGTADRRWLGLGVNWVELSAQDSEEPDNAIAPKETS